MAGTIAEDGGKAGTIAGNGGNPGGRIVYDRTHAQAAGSDQTARGQVSRAVPRYSSPNWPRFSTNRNHRAAPWANSLRRTRLKWGEKVRTFAGTRSPSRKLTGKPRH